MAEFPLPTLETAQAEIAADLVCQRLHAPERERIAAAAWQLGREEGESRLPRRSDELASLAEALGARVVVDEAELRRPRGLFSEYDATTATITLHRGALREWAEAHSASSALADGMALAHELFHHLECQGSIDVQAVAWIPRVVMLGRPLGRCRPRGICEAGAHGFASVMVKTIATEEKEDSEDALV